MKYCISDVHGRVDLFEKLLYEINFSKEDTIYILGDCIDRGGGLSVLLKIMEMASQNNAVLVRGNHEQNFLDCMANIDNTIIDTIKKYYSKKHSFLDEILDSTILQEQYQKLYLSIASKVNLSWYESYLTCDDYLKCTTRKQKEIISFLSSSPMYVDVTANNISYRLLHAGCLKSGETDLLIREDFYANVSPIADKTIVFGHTPTRIIRTKTENLYTMPTIWYDTVNCDKICIDCGCTYNGGRLACIRLDDMKEYYIENESLMTSSIIAFNDFVTKNRYSLTDLKYNKWSL